MLTLIHSQGLTFIEGRLYSIWLIKPEWRRSRIVRKDTQKKYVSEFREHNRCVHGQNLDFLNEYLSMWIEKHMEDC